jgi:hypothetical protein
MPRATVVIRDPLRESYDPPGEHIAPSGTPRLPEVIQKRGAVRLMIAILEQACWSINTRAIAKASGSNNVTVTQRQQREDLLWFFSNERDWLYSFLHICDVLDLDPAAIRQVLRERGRFAGEFRYM